MQLLCSYFCRDPQWRLWQKCVFSTVASFPLPVHQFFHANSVVHAHRRMAPASGIYKAYGVGCVVSFFFRIYLQRSGDTLWAKTSVFETRTCSRCLFKISFRHASVTSRKEAPLVQSWSFIHMPHYVRRLSCSL